MEVILDFNTLRGTKPLILTLKRYDDHTHHFYVPPPPDSLFYCFVQGLTCKNILLRTVPNNTKYFCVVNDYVGKADLSEAYWNPKRKFGKKAPKYKAMYEIFFPNWSLIFAEKCMVTPNSFWNTKGIWYVLLSLHSFKSRKNIPVLVGTTHRKPEYLEMRRMYAQWQY